MSGLWRIHENVGVRSIKFRQLSQTYGYLWQAGTALAQETIRGQPGGGRVPLHILAQSYVNGVVVLGYIPVDVIQPTVADLDVDFASKEQLEEFDEGRYERGSGATLESTK